MHILHLRTPGHTKLITRFLDLAGPFMCNSAKKYKLVGMVLLWVVRMRDKYYALFVGVPC